MLSFSAWKKKQEKNAAKAEMDAYAKVVRKYTRTLGFDFNVHDRDLYYRVNFCCYHWFFGDTWISDSWCEFEAAKETHKMEDVFVHIVKHAQDRWWKNNT